LAAKLQFSLSMLALVAILGCQNPVLLGRNETLVTLRNPEAGDRLEDYQIQIPLGPLEFDADSFSVVDQSSDEPLPFTLQISAEGETDLWVRVAHLEPGETLTLRVDDVSGEGPGRFEDVFTRGLGKGLGRTGAWLFDGADEQEATAVGNVVSTGFDHGGSSCLPHEGFPDGSAMELSGHPSFLTPAPDPTLQPAEGFTVELWLNPSEPDRPGTSWIFALRGARSAVGPSGIEDAWPDLLLNVFFIGNADDQTLDHATDSMLIYGSATGPLLDDPVLLPTLGSRQLTAADFNHDGLMDLYTANYNLEEEMVLDSVIYWGSNDGYSTANTQHLPTLGAITACVEDIDGDGWLDLFSANHRADNVHSIQSYIYWGSPEGYAVERRSELPTHGIYDCAIADMDGDGDLDLVVGLQDDDEWYDRNSWIYWAGPDGFQEDDKTELPTRGVSGVAVGDLNADGFVDLVFSNAVGGEKPEGQPTDPDSVLNVPAWIYWGSDDGFSEDRRTDLPAQGGFSVGIVDFDGDGWLDIAMAQTGSDSLIYLGSADGFSTSATVVIPNEGGGPLSMADLDADGHLDLLQSFAEEKGSTTILSGILWGNGDGFEPEVTLLTSDLGVTSTAIVGGTVGSVAAGRGQQPSRYGEIGLQIDADGTLRGTYRDALHRPFEVSATVTLGDWHHVGYTLEDGILSLVVDGELVATTVGDFNLGGVTYPMPPTLGADADHQGAMRGSLDEVRIYSRALETEALRRHCQQSLYSSVPPEVSVL
jgi:hypothetical protein